MVHVVASRLMHAGEVALWRNGTLVGLGVGQHRTELRNSSCCVDYRWLERSPPARLSRAEKAAPGGAQSGTGGRWRVDRGALPTWRT